MRMLKFNKKEMIDVAIAALIVKNAPRLLGSFAPSFSTGTTGQLAGGILAYVGGMLLKKPTVSNVGLALAVVNVIQDVAIDPAINTVAPGSAATAIKANARYRLSEYVASPKSAAQYAYAYN